MYQSFPATNADRARGDQPANVATGRPARRRAFQAGIAAVALGAAGFAIFSGISDTAQADAPPLPVVTASVPIVRAITEWDDYTGRFEASQSVEIRPRVSGQLTAIHFRDGDFVRKGQLLFTVDQRPYQAALAETRARLATAQTQAALARSEFARAIRLIADEAVSQEEVDTLRAAVRSGEASIAAAQAMLRQRALELEFTQVRAPISGRISDRRVDIGNLVAANETMLTNLVALDPIHFAFDGSEALYLKGARAASTGGERVEVKLQDEADYRWQGRVDFTDNMIDPRSGTMRARAVIANPNAFLTPGMFGNMRLTSGGQRQALLIPDAAVRTDQARKVVFVVGKDGIVAARPVVPGPRIGELRSIRSGLRADDRVVIQGIQLAAPGSKVQVRQGRIAAPSPAGTGSGPQPAGVPAASQATLAN